MKTSCFFTHRGPGGISIASRAPDTFTGRSCKLLAPDRAWLKLDRAEYEAQFAHRLLLLNCAGIARILHLMVQPHEPVLLCYERKLEIAAGKTFCHRRQVARWFERELGIEVEEL